MGACWRQQQENQEEREWSERQKAHNQTKEVKKMGLMAKDDGGKDFEIAPAGAFIANCVQVIDLGMQKIEFKDETKHLHKVHIGFELPTELMEDQRPFMISKRYTLSLNEKSNLRKDLESWRSRAFTDEELAGFDLENILGKPCVINVVHKTGGNGKTYANISNISPLMKGQQPEPVVNQPLFFSLEDYNEQAYQAVPDWLRKVINTSGLNQPQQTMSENPGEGMTQPDFDDDIPF